MTQLRSLLSAFGAMLIASVAFAQDGEPQANVRWYKGSYDYSVLDSTHVRGTEDWTLTVHPDGSRTVETVVDLRELGHQSNAILRVDENFRPLDAYSSFWRFGEYRGAARFWLEADGDGHDILNNSVFGPRGRATHALPFPPHATLRLHPVIIEGWQAATFDKEGPASQARQIYNMVTTGETGVQGIGMYQDNEVAFIGTEEVSTPAGDFTADHMTFYGGRYHIWLWGEDRILVRYTVVSNGREYRLTRLEQGP
jgi:hypothetical protein